MLGRFLWNPCAVKVTVKDLELVVVALFSWLTDKAGSWGRDNMKGILLVTLMAITPGTVAAQQIFKCSDGKGGNTYQQVPCAGAGKQQSVRGYQPVADSPRDYSSQKKQAAQPLSNRAPSARSMQEQAPVDVSGPTGYVRCIKPDGSYYNRRGDSCPQRTEVLQHQAGMVTDVRTGQQQFMVPGGGNGMIDPRTGQRHELISPQPKRSIQDSAQPVSRDTVCAEAKTRLNVSLSDPDRTMNTIRAAEARYHSMCGG